MKMYLCLWSFYKSIMEQQLITVNVGCVRNDVNINSCVSNIPYFFYDNIKEQLQHLENQCLFHNCPENSNFIVFSESSEHDKTWFILNDKLPHIWKLYLDVTKELLLTSNQACV